ncbi:uncharacterized protein F4817DRAFT_345192 [Daldinia loculata]|uniref:uncharacterized protein n=1 Tax=Daldinia loculata TaxID=103429 RepID=UPI0020C22AAF|nr:uncharacterized protein F4817DRAFT_345192 [Daldinia loculata]KAI1644978.1 hypothetical protein F4817DRAFT_345192 [Daldinia loculata]
MSRLPSVEKLPLALRKNIRDEWDNKKFDLEQKLSDTLTTSWTVDVNPNQLYAYAEEGYAKESIGSCIAEYINGAIYRLKEFKDNAGEDGLKELNTICYAHVITIDLDELLREGFHEAVEKGEIAFRIVDTLKYDSYCECEIEDGILYLQVNTFFSHGSS